MTPTLKILRLMFVCVVALSIASAQPTPQPAPPNVLPKCGDDNAKVFVHTPVWGMVSKTYIQDLSAEKFRIDGDEGMFDLKCFSSPDEPIDAGFVIDRSSSALKDSLRLTSQGIRLFIEESNKDNRYFAVGFEQAPTSLMGLTNDRSSIDEFLATLDGLKRQGRTALYDAISMSLSGFAKDSDRRKVLFVFADGDDNYSSRDEDDVLDELRAANVRVYFVALVASSVQMDNTKVNAERRMSRLSAVTRGGVVVTTPKSGIDRILKGMARTLRNEYTIGISPQRALNKFQPIQFRIMLPKQFEQVRTFGTGQIYY